jgi:type II secretory pathway pseudopilin PulG
MYSNTSTRGFTIIEVLVILAVMALIAGIVVGSLTRGRDKADDTKRIADMKEIELAMRAHFEFNGAYPSGNGVELGVGGAIDDSISEYLTEVPDNGYWYDDSFECDGSSHYVLMTEMTEENNANLEAECEASYDDPPGEALQTYVLFLN